MGRSLSPRPALERGHSRVRRQLKPRGPPSPGSQAALRRAYFRRSFSRNCSGCSRRYLPSLQRRAPHNNRSFRPENAVPHSSQTNFAGGVRRAALDTFPVLSRHARVAAFEHARHQEDQPLDTLRFGRNAERQHLSAVRTAATLWISQTARPLLWGQTKPHSTSATHPGVGGRGQHATRSVLRPHVSSFPREKPALAGG
jgi:hypothetical protein